MKRRCLFGKPVVLSMLILFLSFQSVVLFAAAPPPPPPEPVWVPAGTSFEQLVTFRADHNGKYFWVENSGGDIMKANRNVPDGWDEMFFLNASNGNCATLPDGASVNIRTTAGYYFSAQEDGDLDATRTVPERWETFTLVNLSNPGGCLQDGDRIGLKSYHGKYVDVRLDNDEIEARSNVLDNPNEMFTAVFLPPIYAPCNSANLPDIPSPGYEFTVVDIAQDARPAMNLAVQA